MRYLRLPVQTIAAPFLSNLLFLGVFGGFALGRSAGATGGLHIGFIVPGLIFSGAFMSAFQNPVFSLIAMKYSDTLKEFRHYPLSILSKFFGFASAGAVRGFLVALMTWAAAGIFAGHWIKEPIFFWLSMLALSFIASAGGIAFGLRFGSFERANFLVGLVLTPAMYMGGIFYDVKAAGPVFGALARFNPFTAPIGFARSLYLGIPAPVGPVEIVFAAAMAAFFLIFSWMSLASGAGMMSE
jgi:ABC-2 type transport system permease protein